jgi:hypothetical protein
MTEPIEQPANSTIHSATLNSHRTAILELQALNWRTYTPTLTLAATSVEQVVTEGIHSVWEGMIVVIYNGLMMPASSISVDYGDPEDLTDDAVTFTIPDSGVFEANDWVEIRIPALS